MSQLKLEIPAVIPEALAGHEQYLDEAYRRYTKNQLGEMYKKGMQTVWIALVTLLITTSACNSNFFKPESAQITQNSVVVIPAQNTANANTELSATAFVGPPTEASLEKSAVSSVNAPINNIPDFESPEVTNIWDRIQTGMQLQEHTDHERLSTHINRYSRHQDYIDRVTDRAEPFLYLIMEQIEAKNMPTEIALLPIVESAFQPFAYSHGRAAGIWQFIPGTGRMYGLKQDWWYDGSRDIVASTRAALAYLESLHKRLDGDWLLALAAYNSGAGNVWRAIRKNRKKGLPTDFWHLDLPDETRAYVPKLLAISKIIADPQQYNITLKPVLNEPRVVLCVKINSTLERKITPSFTLVGISQYVLSCLDCMLWSFNDPFHRCVGSTHIINCTC